MSSARIKSLEARVQASRGAFAFDERDFDARWVPPSRPGRLMLGMLVLGGGALALAHRLGWPSLLATIGAWRASA